MTNPATASRLELNSFTQIVKDTGCKVKLRNGMIVQPDWEEAYDDTCESYFVYSHMSWNPNGVSDNNPDYDMMELVNA